MKFKLSILALLLCIYTLAQDTQATVTFNTRSKAAMQAQDTRAAIKIRTDTTGGWRKYVVQPAKKLTWWDIAKQFVNVMWDKNPFMVAILGIFLLLGLIKLIRFFIK